MSTIIKAADHDASVHSIAFNFDDMAGRADQYLAKIRKEALKIVAKAQQEANVVRRQAEVDGYKAVEEMVRQQLAEKLATLLPALEKAVQDIQHAKQAWLKHWEKSAIHVASMIAERLIQRELSHRPEITVKWVRDALELAAGSSELRIHLNPDDHQALGPEIETIAKALSGLAPAELIPDPEIRSGGCRIDTRFGTIDQQIEAQLARIEEELT
jgi:flagellar assembly protein FliH